MASFIPRALLAKLTSKGGDSSDSAPRRRSRTIVVPRGFGHGVPGMIESYAVGRELGRGAQGRVYEAYSTLSKKFVAIKLFHHRHSTPLTPIDMEEHMMAADSDDEDGAHTVTVKDAAGELGPADEPLLWNGVPLQLRERRAAEAAPAPASDGLRASERNSIAVSGAGSEISALQGLSGRRSTLDMVRTDGCATTNPSPSASLRIGWGASSRDQFPTHPNILRLLRVVPNCEYD